MSDAHRPAVDVQMAAQDACVPLSFWLILSAILIDGDGYRPPVSGFGKVGALLSRERLRSRRPRDHLFSADRPHARHPSANDAAPTTHEWISAVQDYQRVLRPARRGRQRCGERGIADWPSHNQGRPRQPSWCPTQAASYALAVLRRRRRTVHAKQHATIPRFLALRHPRHRIARHRPRLLRAVPAPPQRHKPQSRAHGSARTRHAARAHTADALHAPTHSPVFLNTIQIPAREPDAVEALSVS